MAPKKKAPKNAFYFFMCDYESKCRKSGRPFPGGLQAISEKVSPIWNAMSAEERRPYEEQAHAAKGSRQKLTTHGQTYEEVEQERRQKEMKQETMLQTIRSTVQNLPRDNGLSTATFFLFHMNYSCRTGDGVYYPAEVAISAFSIQDGMQVPYHTLINSGPLPTGYAYKARQHADETHRIDSSLRLGEKDCCAIVAAIEDYIEHWKNLDSEPGMLPPLYTLEKFIPSVEEMLARWAAKCDKPPDYFRVYELEELFHQLKNASLKPTPEGAKTDDKLDQGFVFSSVAGKKLGDDPFSYRPHIACELHEELDVVQHCSRSYVVRWGWLMCEHVCYDMGVDLVPGQHCPYGTTAAQRPPPPQTAPVQESSVGPRAFTAALPATAAQPPPMTAAHGAIQRTAGFGRGIGRAPLASAAAGHVPQGNAWGGAAAGNVPQSNAWGGAAAFTGGDPSEPGQFSDADFFPALTSRRRNKP